MNQRKGIIVKTLDYKDSSKIIYIISENGLESLLVRGAKKNNSKNFAYSQILTKIKYSLIKSKTFDVLTTGEIDNNFSLIKGDLSKTKYAYQILELSYQFINHIEKVNLFYNFLDEILNRVNDSIHDSYYELIFRLKLLYLLGVGPIFNTCIVCGSKNLRGFSLYSGGSKCINCVDQNDYFYNAETIDVIKNLYLTKLEIMDDNYFGIFPNVYRQVDEFINSYYNYFLGYTSNVTKVFSTL